LDICAVEVISNVDVLEIIHRYMDVEENKIIEQRLRSMGQFKKKEKPTFDETFRKVFCERWAPEVQDVNLSV
jgi:hypothetical protein